MERSGVLITGATGFIGRNLARRLRQRGETVAAIVRPESEIGFLTDMGVACHIHDGTADGLADILAGICPETVFHLASRFIAEHKPSDIESLISTNLHFATQLVDAMARTGVNQLVNTGTSWESLSDAVAEPVCLYAATKAAFQPIMDYYRSAHGLKTVTLKLYDTFGPDDPRPKLISLLQKISASGELFDMSGGDQIICPLYIDDVTAGFEQAAREVQRLAAGEGRSYALPGPERLSLRDFVALFSDVFGRQPQINWGARPYRAREVMSPWTGPVLPDWHAAITLRDGLALTLKRTDNV
ncbi:NAD-dependent epimerase/dehydratase family protein [Allorhizobium borbori]|uniref:Nucleoside-diphosphate-sugar epimerase n=1 Tax=Allorhizobium borbori TaxID=485907 RepID=A0A7W6K3M1_9HYPH|nr:NAD(P)-dependent oxidoreductase [Allorhizobium borbori]MBB4104583.1 nucleoside-diphosphate-sugar epimerase [Allorhizobium borbori]